MELDGPVLVLVKDFEHERGKVGRVALWEELLVDLLEAGFSEHSVWTVPHESFVPLFYLFFCD